MNAKVPPIKPYAEEVDTAGVEIMRLHDMAQQSAESAIQFAIEAGERLTAKKEGPDIQHGYWIPYVESLGISRYTAAAYMRLAKANVQSSAHLSINEALKALATPKEKKQPADLFTPQHEDQEPPIHTLTKDERNIIKESNARAGKMIAEFAEERREAIQRSIDNKWHDEHDPRSKAISLGLEILASLRELAYVIERKNVAPIIEPTHLEIINEFLKTITNCIEE